MGVGQSGRRLVAASVARTLAIRRYGDEIVILGEWWVANPTGGGTGYRPPDPSERLPGTLREIGRGEFVLETIGFLGDQLFGAGGASAPSDGPSPQIWGTDRDATCYSLFDNLRTSTRWSPSHVSDGHEDWRVGWLARGNAWVTPDEECTDARIRIDDLHRWALYPRPSNIEFDDAGETAVIRLREETLFTTMIGDTSVSLVSGYDAKFDPAGEDPTRNITFANAVSWKLEGPVTLRAVVEDWIGPFESFSRFMTMRPSVVSRIKCRLPDLDGQPVEEELMARRLERPSRAADRGGDPWPPFKYLGTLRTLEEVAIDPADVLAGYWEKVATGDARMAMALHLESQDRLLSRGPDGALLNAVRSVESLYAIQHPTARAMGVQLRDKIDDAVCRAGDVGTQLVDAWPAFSEIVSLRNDAAHGVRQSDASFGLRCHGGALALQWIQRVRLLTELGLSESAARSIVSDNFQYESDLRDLQSWSAEIGG